MLGNELLVGGLRSLTAFLVINMRKALFNHGEGQNEEFWMMRNYCSTSYFQGFYFYGSFWVNQGLMTEVSRINSHL